MNPIEDARKFRKAMEGIAPTLDDAKASTVPQMFDCMKYDGSLIKVGTRINWHGTLKRASVDIWDTEQNNPDNAPNLWENLAYKEGIRIIPHIITVTAAFSEGEPGWWDGRVYRSKVDANVHTPAQNPAGWEAL